MHSQAHADSNTIAPSKDKAIADQHKRAVEVEAGDRVLLSTRNLKLKGKTGTFKPKYVGPFPILRMVGDNACELELPEAMKIHPVVNVSQVKKYHGSLQRPPPIEIDGEEEYEVEDILDHRRSGRGYQYLVSWTGYDASENQWLPEREL